MQDECPRRVGVFFDAHGPVLVVVVARVGVLSVCVRACVRGFAYKYAGRVSERATIERVRRKMGGECVSLCACV